MKSLLHLAAFVFLAVASAHAQIVATGNTTLSAGPNPFVLSQWEEFRNDSGHTVNVMVTLTNNLSTGWGVLQGDPGVPTLNGIAPGATFWLATYSCGPGGYGFYSEQRAITGYWIVSTPVTITWNVISPTGNPTLIANGASQTGATATVSPANAPVTIAGNSAVNAGTYTATATLTNTSDYSWAAGQTTSVSWAIGAAAPPVPKVTISASPQSLPGADLSKPIVNPIIGLTWTSSNATSVTVSCDIGGITIPYNTDLNGTNVQVTLPANTDTKNSVTYTFKINGSGPGGNAVPDSKQVVIQPAIGIVIHPLKGHAAWEADQAISVNPSTAFTMTKKVTNDGVDDGIGIWTWDTTNYFYEVWTSWGGFLTNGLSLTPNGPVAIGGSSNVSFSLTAPSTPGTYTVTLKPIIPGVGYFLNVGTYTVIVAGSGPSSYVLTTAANPANAGSVSGGGTYAAGSNATATASANANWQLTGFTGADSTSGNTATVTMNSNRTVTANFIPIGSTYSVTVSVPAAAAAARCTAAASPATGIASGGSSTLTNTAAGGYIFNGYTINSGTCTANGSTLTNITSNISVTANFIQPSPNVQIVVGIDSPPLGNADCSLKIITQPNGGTVQSGQNYLMLTLPRSAITPYSSFSVSGALTTPGYEIYRWDITGATKTSDSNASTPSANGSAGIGTPYGDYITATARTRIIQMHGPSVTMQDTLPTLVLSPGNPPQTSVPVTVKSNGTVVGWYAQVFYGSGSNAYCTPSGGTLMPGQSATTTVYTPPMNQAGPYKIVVTAALPAPSLPMYHFGDPMNQTNTTAYPVYINYWGYYQGTDDPPTAGPPASAFKRLVQPGGTYPESISFWPTYQYSGYAQSATWADPTFTVTKEATGMITEAAYVSLRFKVVNDDYVYHWAPQWYYDEDRQSWYQDGKNPQYPDQWLLEDPSECWTLTPSDGYQSVGPGLVISIQGGGGDYRFSHWEDEAGTKIKEGNGASATVTVPSGSPTYYAVMKRGGPKTPITVAASPLWFAYDGQTHGPTNIASIAGNPPDPSIPCNLNTGIWQATAPGDYTYTLSTSDEYTITSVNGIAGNGPVRWSIGSAPQTITLSPVSSTITAGSSITFTAEGGKNGYDWSSTVGALDPGTMATKTVSFPNVGTFTVSAQSPVGGNYAVSNLATANVIVTPVPITNFDFAPKTFTYIPNTKQGPTITSTPNGASYSTAGNVKEIIVHKYHFAVDGTGDYTGHAECDWEITKAHADVTLGSLGQIYDGNPSYATATTTPGGLNVTMTYDGGTTAPINVGLYDVGGTVNDPNYEGSATGKLEVKKADQQITFDSLPGRTYGDAPFAVSANAVNTANGQPSLPVSFRVLSGPATINANTVTITGATGADPVTIQAYQDGNANYNPAPSVNRTFAVAKAPATVTLGSLNQTYDGTPKAATASTTPSGLTVNLTYNGSATAPTAAGSYAVVGTVSDPNYTGSAAGTLTIAKATPTVTWATPAAITYGTALSATQLDATASVPGSFVYTPAAGTVRGAGAGQSLSVTFTPTDTANYNSASATTTITVNQASLTATANNQSKAYGAANPALTISYSGFVNGDTSASITQPGIATAATAASGVGTYPITLSGGSAANYSLTLVNGTLTVNSVTLTVTANNQSRAYGSVNPALTVAYSGFVNGDTAAALTTAPTASTVATAASAAGTYAITPAGGVSPNYVFSYVNGTLTITKVGLTATANNQSKVYGAANPSLTIGYSGFVNGDTTASITQPGISTAVTAGSAVGSYPITLSGGAATNYTLTLVNGTLTVTPATLAISANNASKVYGATNPVFGYTPSGFVNGDTAAVLSGAPSLTTTATAASGVGSYTIAAAAGSLSATNYTFSYSNGTLTVTAAALTVTANNQSKTYGSANPALTATLSGFVSGDTAAAVSGSASVSTTALTSSAVGSYPITPTAGTLSAANYTFGPFNNGTLTVTAATVTPSVTASSKVYDGSTAATITGRSLAGVIGADAVTLTGGSGIFASKTVGTGQTVTVTGLALSGAAAGNYQLSSTTATTTADITAKNLTTTGVTASSKGYDGGTVASPNFGGASLVGVVGGDTVTLATGGVTGMFASKTVGTGKTVTVSGLGLSGADAGNYTLTQPTTTANITVKTLTVSGVTAADKVYDGTTVATLNWGSAALMGVVGGDLASLVTTGASGTFSDKNVANGKTVTVAGLALNGADSGNYSLTQPSAIANITQATPTITWAAPAAITYGTALSVTQLDATASVPGSFVYAQAAGTVLNAGAGQALTVAFTPTDTTNYTTASGGTTITVNKAGQIVTLTPLASTVLLGTPIAYTAAGSSTGAYAWGGNAGASGSGASQTVNPAGGPGNYTVTVYAPGNSNYNDSPLVNATIVMQAPTLTLSLTPLVSNYTVTDTSSPLNGKTYKRTWQDGGTWHAYLGRSGEQFQIVGQGTTAVQAFELQALEPNADPSAWYSLATIAPPTGATNGPGVGVTGVFSVSLDTASTAAALVPQSYAQGNPKTGVWQLRARTQDNSGTWSDWSNIVTVTVDLPLTTTAIPAQSLPPAGPIGGWFTASDQKTFNLPVWIP